MSLAVSSMASFEAAQVLLKGMAGTTGLEPATSAVTGQRSNQLNYVPNLLKTSLDKVSMNLASRTWMTAVPVNP